MAKNVRLHPLVRGKLADLKTALRTDYGLPATQQTIANALIHEATPGQAAGMLMAYTRYLAVAAPDEDGEDDED